LYGAAVQLHHRISIARDQYKFSCAHMTVFPDGTKERLHGHNYTVALAVDLDRADLDAMVAFAPLKAALAELCAEWKERFLLATRNRYLSIARDEGELEFTLCGDRYVLPRGDVLLLPVDNISVEALAAHVAERLAERLTVTLAAPHIRALEVTVSESPGQGASCKVTLR
jgi:6-pyruvoyltetrahydropterin/6-carboxytetrahydropterin synthase